MDKARSQSSLAEGLFLVQFFCLSLGWVAPPAVIHTLQHFRQDNQITVASTFGWWAIDKFRRFGDNFLCTRSPTQQPSVRKEYYFCKKFFKTYLGCQASLSARTFLQLHKLCYMWGTRTLRSWSFCSVRGREVLISLLYRDNWSARGQKPQLQKIRKAKLTLLELCWFIPAEHMAS